MLLYAINIHQCYTLIIYFTIQISGNKTIGHTIEGETQNNTEQSYYDLIFLRLSNAQRSLITKYHW